MKKVLVVDDEPSILTLLTFNLEKEGYQVTTSENGKNGFELALSNQYDFIILDVMLPGMDGLEITKALRREKIDTPILILTAKDEQVDKIIGLEIGADDYLTKPFNPLELVARVKSQLRRYYRLNPKVKAQAIEEISNIVTIEDLEINLDTHEIFIDGKEVKLTPTEFDILVLLAKNRGKVFSISNIYESVWNQEFMESDNTVMVHIRKIREKIESDPRKPRFIKTVWGVGYKIEK